MNKKCNTCKRGKRLSLFNKDKNTKDGYSHCCRKCSNDRRRKWGKLNPSNDKEPISRFYRGKKAAEKRRLEWNLKLEEYTILVNNLCYYCNSSIAEEVGVGLDRLDNNKGYIANNVVTCCGPCNIGRHTNFTPEEWKVAIKAIKDFRIAQVSSNGRTSGFDPLNLSSNLST